MSPVDLKDYVDVKERIRLFLERYPEGRVVTGEVRATSEPDGVPRVWVQAFAYRDPTDIHPGTGWSWMQLPGTTNFTRGSEIENTETSAWGRAIGATGVGIAASIATTDEIRAKEVKADVDHGDDGSLIGTVQVGDRITSDFVLRNTPDGRVIGFRLRGDKGGILVRASGQLAVDLDQMREQIVGQRATCWGRVVTESFTPKGKPAVSYQVLEAERITVPGLPPMPTAVGPVEAPTEPLFDELERIGA